MEVRHAQRDLAAGTGSILTDGSTEMRDVASIGVSIRTARRAAGITQQDLAHLAGTSVRTVRAIETATGNPSLQAVVAVTNVLGLQLMVR